MNQFQNPHPQGKYGVCGTPGQMLPQVPPMQTATNLAGWTSLAGNCHQLYQAPPIETLSGYYDSAELQGLKDLKKKVFGKPPSDLVEYSQISIQFTKAGFDHLAMLAINAVHPQQKEMLLDTLREIREDGWTDFASLSLWMDLAVATGLLPTHYELNFRAQVASE